MLLSDTNTMAQSPVTMKHCMGSTNFVEFRCVRFVNEISAKYEFSFGIKNVPNHFNFVLVYKHKRWFFLQRDGEYGTNSNIGIGNCPSERPLQARWKYETDKWAIWTMPRSICDHSRLVRAGNECIQNVCSNFFHFHFSFTHTTRFRSANSNNITSTTSVHCMYMGALRFGRLNKCIVFVQCSFWIEFAMVSNFPSLNLFNWQH